MIALTFLWELVGRSMSVYRLHALHARLVGCLYSVRQDPKFRSTRFQNCWKIRGERLILLLVVICTENSANFKIPIGTHFRVKRLTVLSTVFLITYRMITNWRENMTRNKRMTRAQFQAGCVWIHPLNARKFLHGSQFCTLSMKRSMISITQNASLWTRLLCRFMVCLTSWLVIPFRSGEFDMRKRVLMALALMGALALANSKRTGSKPGRVSTLYLLICTRVHAFQLKLQRELSEIQDNRAVTVFYLRSFDMKRNEVTIHTLPHLKGHLTIHLLSVCSSYGGGHSIAPKTTSANPASASP